MARVLKQYKSYKGFKITGTVGLVISILIVVLNLVFAGELPFSSDVMAALFLSSILGIIIFMFLLIIGVIYGGIRSRINKSLSMLDDSYVILYDIVLPEYNTKVNAFIISPQGAYCMSLIPTQGIIYGDDQSPKWRAYNPASKSKNTYFNNPVTEVLKQADAVNQKLLSSGINLKITPIVVFGNSSKLSEVRTNYPVMHAEGAAQFIADNKFSTYANPEQIASILTGQGK